MGVILDTVIWVNVERGRLAPGDVAEVTQEDPVYLTPPVLAELEYGVHRASTAEQRNRRAAAIGRIRRKPCLVIGKQTAEIFARVAADLDTSGTPAKHRLQDLWIASLALEHGMKVLTRNEKDFDDVPGLDLLLI